MDSGLLMALRLSKEGFGTLEEILAMPADLVLAAWEYVGFLGDYEETAMEINRPQE